MSAADTHRLSELAAGEKREIKVEVEEKKRLHDDLRPLSNNDNEPTFPPTQTKNLHAKVSTQLVGRHSRFQVLPDGLAEELAERVFENEEELEAALEKLGLSDEPIVWGEDGKAYYYTPGENHNNATRYIVRTFYKWGRVVKGVAGENTNMRLGPKLTDAPPQRKRLKRKTRLPDVALWGRTKCTLDEDGNVLEPMCVSADVLDALVHPHGDIQVILFNDEDYEIDAINDLSTRATPEQGAPPNLSILIKLRNADAANGIQAGFDIYYLPTGTYVRDAIAGARGARHVVFNHGGPNVIVTITEEQLGGINLSFWQSIKDWFLGGSKDFELSMSELYKASV